MAAMKSVSLFVGATLLAATLALTPIQAEAATQTGGYKGCSSNYHVYTTSKSAGYTRHNHYKSSGTYGWSFGNVSAASPYRSFHSQDFRSIDSWSVSADVLESASSGCTANPV